MDASEKMDESCRLCDENCDKMYSVFDKNEEGLEMLRLIKECLPIIIYRTDPLSKIICESCYNNVNALYTFKKIAEETADRQKEKLRASVKFALNKTKISSEDSPPIDSEGQPADNDNDAMETESRTDPESKTPDMPDEDSIRMFLACDEEPEEGSELKDKGTSTEGLSIYCSRCKQPVPDTSSANGELELCTDLHKVIAESMAKNKVATASEKSLRKRKVVPFYHELEDSLCSSLTELTQNTEGSQCFDMASDFEDSLDSDEIQPRLKRRRIIESDEENENDDENDNDESVTNSSNRGSVRIKKSLEINGNLERLFVDEEDYRFQPLSLLNIALNCINKQNVPDYDPENCEIELMRPRCQHCGTRFQNYKLLAIHEVQHMDVEIDEKIDNPTPWSEDREDAAIRNKWLMYFDENGYGDDDIVIEDSVNADSLLIPMEEKADASERVLTGEEKIVLDGTQPMVNGVYLGDYTKEERKSFYQTMRIQGVNKKYCELCRYTFKDNWAIEGHYFSSACYYTCRYCGMRFNKQRHKFKEHVEEHKERKDPISEKVYAASKVSNIVPKVLHPPKPRRVVPPQYANNNNNNSNSNPQPFREQNNHSIRVRNFTERRPFGPNIQIKEEPGEPTKEGVLTPSKTAFFCRKCYKVFFKLEEFNVHSKHCDYNQLPQRPANNKPPAMQQPVRNGEMSSTGRPVRNCAKEIGPYKDEAFLPDSVLKEPRGSSSSNQTFICYICNTPFPTIYSRNSHMRIHKAEGHSMSPMPPFYRTPQPRPQQHHPQNNHFQNYRNPPMRQQNFHMSQHMMNVDIKQEPMDMPMEPMVEIHEQEPSYPDSIGDGAVSITPINKKPNPKPALNPSIMRMVQNNPSISIKPRTPEKVQSHHNMANVSSSSNQIHMNNINMSMAMGVPLPDDNRSYKCSSCWEAFANKSHLYFHKKNQCEGSRLPCPFCKKRFGTEAEYSSHIYYSHPE